MELKYMNNNMCESYYRDKWFRLGFLLDIYMSKNSVMFAFGIYVNEALISAMHVLVF